MKAPTSLFAGVSVGVGFVIAMAAFDGSRSRAFSAGATPAPAAQAGFGTIKGRLVWGSATIPEPVKIDPGNVAYCAKSPLVKQDLVIDSKTKGIANGFAYVVSPKGSNPDAVKALLAARPKLKIDNNKCQFVPHSTAAHKDQTFLFTSSDEVGHNVHYTSFVPANNKNFTLNAGGSAEEKLAVDKRQISLQCDIHPWMKGHIMVFDHPFFAVTKEDGSFEITGVPAGAQQLIVWQEKVGYVTAGLNKGMAVEVKADGVTDVGEVRLDPTKIKN